MMSYSDFKTLFLQIFLKNGIERDVSEEMIESFFQLTEIMVRTNQVMNITALTTEEKIIPLHYADCVKISEWLPRGANIMDIGCGGGFPLLPLAIVRPDLQITGLDSTEKKIKYVENTAKQLGLSIKAISGRAEDLAKDPLYREQYDVVISRAVARLNVLDELCLPFVKVGGEFLAMKGSAGIEEMNEANTGIGRLGGKIMEYPEYDLYTADNAEKRFAIRSKKTQKTPIEFPRAFGAIKKRPL